MTYKGTSGVTGSTPGGKSGEGTAYVYSSVYMQNTFINHLLRSSSASTTGSSWIALFLEEDNHVVTEITGGSYARIKTTGSWSISSTGSSAFNTWDIYFPTATSDWGKITHLGILNGSQAGVNSGSFLFYGPLSGSKLISTGDVFVFFAKDIQIMWTGGYSYYSGSKLINYWLNDVKFAPPGTNKWCGLYITLPSIDGTGGVEVSASTGYARIKVGGTGSWVVPSSGSTTNAYPMIFATTLTEANQWGTLEGFCILDAASSGNVLYRGQIYPRISVLSPDGMMFEENAIKVYSDIGYTPPVVA